LILAWLFDLVASELATRTEKVRALWIDEEIAGERTTAEEHGTTHV
jgi:hypothetical protein